MKTDLAVIGAGPAGLAAATAARESGVEDIVVIERDREAGGILNQCIHSGFGLRYFKTELTGPEYAERFRDKVSGGGIRLLFDTMALSVAPNRITALNSKQGLLHIEPKAVVLAMGCRERTRSAIATPGSRPSGIMTAGLAQRYINIEGRMVGKRAVILGSGDIGLIMARRLTLEGAKVLACVEIMPYSSGLTRNIAQCLDDYDIPLLLSHTVTDIYGRERLQGVKVSKVGADMLPMPGTEIEFACDTLLLSVGLIPENELSKSVGIDLDRKTSGPYVNESMETSVPGIFACGNVVHVHDVVDFVTEESRRAGLNAASYVKGGLRDESAPMNITVSGGLSYCVPHKIRYSALPDKLDLFMRVEDVYEKARIVVSGQGKELAGFKKINLTPGEMIRLSIKKSILENVTGDIEISLAAL